MLISFPFFVRKYKFNTLWLNNTCLVLLQLLLKQEDLKAHDLVTTGVGIKAKPHVC
jgi:hypothetical protein